MGALDESGERAFVRDGASQLLVHSLACHKAQDHVVATALLHTQQNYTLRAHRNRVYNSLQSNSPHGLTLTEQSFGTEVCLGS